MTCLRPRADEGECRATEQHTCIDCGGPWECIMQHSSGRCVDGQTDEERCPACAAAWRGW